MPEWLVYDHAYYYPSMEIIEAPTAKEAAALHYSDAEKVVLPLDAIVYVSDTKVLDEMRRGGLETAEMGRQQP